MQPIVDGLFTGDNYVEPEKYDCQAFVDEPMMAPGCMHARTDARNTARRQGDVGGPLHGAHPLHGSPTIAPHPLPEVRPFRALNVWLCADEHAW